MRQKQTSDDWTLDLFGGHVELFFFLFLFFTVKEETAAARHYRPQHVSARHTHQQKREWRARQRQTDNLCTDVFSFSDWCVWDRRSMLWDVSQAPHSISTTTFSMELIDLRAGCEGGSGPCRQPGTAFSTQLPAMYLCMLPCVCFHLQGSKPESMLGKSACGCKAWMIVCIYLYVSII